MEEDLEMKTKCKASATKPKSLTTFEFIFYYTHLIFKELID